MNPKVFPSLLIVIYLSASAVYGLNGDWRHAVYWIAAATITVVITF